MSVQVKICGIRDKASLKAAVDAGADYIGFVFFPASPRNIKVKEAKKLTSSLPSNVKSVGLFVDPSDGLLDDVLDSVKIDILQLHGSETPERTAEIKDKYNLPVMKAFPVSDGYDIMRTQAYFSSVDWYLFDAKPPADSKVPGGTGTSFDWGLLQGRKFDKPWMLSGGLTPENVGEALGILTPDAVDVSSGVEAERGVKDTDKIKAFLAAAKGV